MSEDPRSSQSLQDIELSPSISDKEKLVVAKSSSSASLLSFLTSKVGISLILLFVAANIVLWVCLGIFVFDKSNSSSNDDDLVSSTFDTIFPENFIVTGIRQDMNNDVIITGGTGLLNSSAWIYHGPLSNFPTTDTDPDMYTYFWPHFPNQTTNATTLYSCNTHYFDTRIPEGNMTAVGSYNYEESAITESFLYKGDFSGHGEYTEIKIPPQWFVNETSGLNITREVGHTVAHSIMGDIIVGNWLYAGKCDLLMLLVLSSLMSSYADEYDRGHVFIMNMVSGEVNTVDEGLYFGLSVTFYGVWQNGGMNSTKYTIAGGIYTGEYQNQEHAFLQSYDSRTQTLGPLVKYLYNNDSSYSTHFEGIAGVEGGFSMAVSQIKHGITTASYCFVPYNLTTDTYGEAKWILINNTVVNPEFITSGNTVIDYSVLGVYTTEGGMASFIVDVSSIFF